MTQNDRKCVTEEQNDPAINTDASVELSKSSGADNIQKPFLTYDEYWEALRRTIGKTTLRQWGHSGKLKTVRIGRKILVPVSELLELPKRLMREQ